MLNLFNDSSREFKIIIHHLLDEVVGFFMEIGSNLDYEHIYADVFPLHLEENEESGLKTLKKIERNIRDGFNHDLSALEEYVLYKILIYVYEGSEDGFRLDDLVDNNLVKEGVLEKLLTDEFDLLKSIQTPRDLMGLCFEDLDFLDIDEIFELYKKNPEIVTDFLHIELDYYTELMPEDIYLEYKKLGSPTELQVKQNIKEVKDKESFIDTVNALLDGFNQEVIHTGLNKIINNPSKQFGEKQVQLLFKVYAKAFLRNTDIVILSEVDTGRGYVDFHLSVGKDYQVLLEFKLDNHNSVHEGMHYQLPTYLIAQEVHIGFYVLVCCKQELYEKYAYLEDDSNELSSKYNKDIMFFRIDAIGNLKTASKIKTDTDMKL